MKRLADPGKIEELLKREEVAISGGFKAVYPETPPFNPSVEYPEYPLGKMLLSDSNPVYEAVRDSLIMLGLDKEKFGSPDWNPLGEIIEPGNKVVIKPNAVLDRNVEGADVFSVITHPSVIRAIVDFVYIALKGEGEIVIADAPQFNCNFDNYLHVTKLESIQGLYRSELNFNIPILDLRRLRGRIDEVTGIASAVDMEIREGDPLGYSIVDLGEDSALSSLAHCERIYGADYDRRFASSHHLDGKHEYCVSNTVLSADVLINVPKLKVHRKTGVTLNIKGLVGINGDKNYLPHYRVGPPVSGGDEFPDGVGAMRRSLRLFQRLLVDRLLAPRDPRFEKLYLGLDRAKKAVVRILKRSGIAPPALPENVASVSSGDWYGNDTAWRMVVDLVRILFYADGDGLLQDRVQRRFFSVIDGIIGGEGEGPLRPTPKSCGVILAGFNPVAVDVVATHLMGFDHRHFAQLLYYKERKEEGAFFEFPDRISVLLDKGEKRITVDEMKELALGFKLPLGWQVLAGK